MTQSPLFPEPSVARRIDREMFLLLGGTAALLMQVAHPLVAAGVERHSDFRGDPIGRLHRTLDTTLAVVFGDEPAARRAIERIDARHVPVRGTTEGGHGYTARDPRLLLWVQATLVLTSLRWYEAVLGPIGRAARQGYWDEARPIARALGIPEALMPATVEDLEEYERRALATEVMPDGASLAVGHAVLRPFAWVPDIVHAPADAVTAALLPARLREAFGLRFGRAERLLYRAVVVAVRVLHRALPDVLTVVPQARRYEAARRVRA